MRDSLNPDYSNLSQDFLRAGTMNSGSFLQQMIGTSMTLASVQRELNLSKEEMMTQAVRASLVNQPVAGLDKEMKAIEDAKFSSLVGRRNTSRSSNAVEIITIHNFGNDNSGGKMPARPRSTSPVPSSGRVTNMMKLLEQPWSTSPVPAAGVRVYHRIEGRTMRDMNLTVK